MFGGISVWVNGMEEKVDKLPSGQAEHLASYLQEKAGGDPTLLRDNPMTNGAYATEDMVRQASLPDMPEFNAALGQLPGVLDDDEIPEKLRFAEYRDSHQPVARHGVLAATERVRT